VALGPPPDEIGKDLVGDAEIIYRRLFDASEAFVAIDQITGERRPSSGAFKPDSDGVSVYRQDVLARYGLTTWDLRQATVNLIVSLTCSEVRSIDLDVKGDPWPTDVDDPKHPRNAAHALITGWEGLGTKQRLRRQRALVRLPSVAFVPDDAAPTGESGKM
jgi:hypothetical protein